jgi:aspartyl protease family protein
MRFFLVFAILAIGVASFGARFADKLAARQAPSAMAAQGAASSGGTSGSSLMVMPDRMGHFHVDARVDGRPMQFVVDTGASTIALTARSAAQLGIHPAPRDFTDSSHTANGVIRVAPVRLSMVEVGGIMVRDVSAHVFPEDVLGENLLGTSFLSRLRRYEYANGRLVLEQ